MRSEFEKHFLSLKFASNSVAQTALDACTFDKDQNMYLPNMDWFLHNSDQEGVAYYSMVNTCYMSFQSRQTEVDELQAKFDQHDQWLGQRNRDVQELNDIIAKHVAEKNELQKRVDAALIKLDKRWNESWSNWKENAYMQEQGAANAFEEAYWLLEQALKGGSDENQ